MEHEEVENENRQPLIAGSPIDDVAHNQDQFIPENLVDREQTPPVGDENRRPLIEGSPSQVFVPSPPLLVDDVADNNEQFLESISPSLLASPENLVDCHQPPSEDDNRQPPIAGSPSKEFVLSPTLLVDDMENSVDRQSPPPPPEHGADQHESPAPPSPIPEEKISDGEQQLIAPPLTAAEHLSENYSPNHQSPLSKQSPSPPASTPPIEPEYPPENQTQSPSLLASPQPIESDYPPENLNPISKQPSLSPSAPPTDTEYSSKNPILNQESPLSKQPLSPNLTPNHESPLIKPTPSPSPSQLVAEGPPNPNSDLSPISKQSPKDLSPSPPPQDTLEPNTLTPPLGVPLLLHAASTFSPSKPHISPWTHQETANLIQAYQEKWYSLKKGPLKAGQWEEVAITVAARCGYDEPTKTSKQCRHKIEKLRKRYRAERGKPRSKATAWNFFKLMDNLEKGPLPISSSQPMELVEYQKPSTSNVLKRKNDVCDDGGGDREFLANKRSSTSRNTNHPVANGGLTRNLRFSDGENRVVRGLRTPVIHKRKEVYQEEREEENNENGGEEDVATQLAAEIKGFAQKFIKMENKKIEMMRDVERYRLEMENKRMEMIIESQQMLVETVNNAFGSSVKTHKLSAS